MAGCHWLREKKLEMRKKKNPKPGGGRRLLLSGVRDRFRFRLFFLYFFLMFPKLTPLHKISIAWYL